MAFLALAPEVLAGIGEAGAATAATAGAAEAGAGVAAAGAGAAEAGAGAGAVGAGAAEAGGGGSTVFQRAQGMIRDFNDSPVGKVVGSRSGRTVISGVGQGMMQSRQQRAGGANIGPMGNI